MIYFISSIYVQLHVIDEIGYTPVCCKTRPGGDEHPRWFEALRRNAFCQLDFTVLRVGSERPVAGDRGRLLAVRCRACARRGPTSAVVVAAMRERPRLYDRWPEIITEMEFVRLT